MQTIQTIDSHTEGEPTRVVIAGAPDLGAGTAAERLARLREHDWFRSAVVNEPRGFGRDGRCARVLEPHDPSCEVAQVIYFNNVGYLGMCGHGTIGLAVDARAHSVVLERRDSHRGRHRQSGGLSPSTCGDSNRVIGVDNVPSRTDHAAGVTGRHRVVTASDP